MTTRVCSVGSVNLDTVLGVDTLPRPGETVLATSVRSTPGGKGANQAVAAARAGARVQFVGAVGDDAAGVRLQDHLWRNGVGIDGLVTLPGASGAAVVMVDSVGENAIVVAPGANAELTMDSARIRAIVAGSDVVLLQLEIPAAAAVAAARAARAAGAVVMVNASPAGRATPELAELADVLIVNESEAEHWVWPVAHRVITRGSAGATCTTADIDFAVPAPVVDAVDTAGAGDVFAGVLAADWPAGRRYALRRACAAGALATLVRGAGDCAPSSAAIDGAVTGD
ncbi:PfkB family carbohydrate kinase [Mycobacterium sp.]|uniref:PfkB family carbohydrate kinase n=1 Tax=Mycobacterium sp. TaxID=1785 RepID=UPI0031CDB92A